MGIFSLTKFQGKSKKNLAKTTKNLGKTKKHLFFLFFIISFSYSQPNEGETVRFQFVKVEKGDIEEFEIFMTDFVGKAASKAVENGKLENWILRRVSQNSEYNSQFSHMIIWVVPKNTPTWDETWNSTILVYQQILDPGHGQKVKSCMKQFTMLIVLI